MIIITAFHRGDADAAVRLYDWIRELGSHKYNTVFVTDPDVPTHVVNRVLLAGRRAMGNAVVIKTDGKHKREWPFGPNAAFITAAQYAAKVKQPFLWLEPDCVPTRKTWLQEIEHEYGKCGKRYMGGIVYCNPPLPRKVLYGVAVYHPSAIEIVSKRVQPNMGVAFDVSMSEDTVPLSFASKLFQFSGGNKPTKINPAIALFHKDKTGKTIASLKNPNQEKDEKQEQNCLPNIGATGFHYGDRGDVIYSLPVCRLLGISHLVLCPHHMTREKMTEESADSIASLVRAQPYIDSVVFTQTPPVGAIDLNEFREMLGPQHSGRFFYHNLSSLQLRAFGYPEWFECDQWLWVTQIKPPKPVVIARSSRYQSKTFNWKDVYKKYGRDAVFIGSPGEHKEFCDSVGFVEYYKTENLLKVAQVIAGSELFIGNQSCPFAIAEGLKHPAILEWTDGPAQNCHFSRKNLYYGTERIKIPDVKRKTTVNWVALSDLHSGFGRMAHAFYIRSKKIDFNWVPTRFSEDFCAFDKSINLSNKRLPCSSVVLDSIPVIHNFAQSGDIALSMWESTRLPKAAVTAINNCKAAIVPSQWCRDVYIDSGIKVPIYKVPLGVDSVLYRPPQVREKKDVIVFGASSRFCNDGNPRKNVIETIEGFKLAFEGKNDVRLLIKGYDAKAIDVDDPRIQVVSEFWSESKLANWYQSLDCFINIPRGGGWELHVHEAMLCGAVPIVLNYSSSLEFVTNGCGYLVDYNTVAADWHVYKGCGEWALPNMDHYVHTLRHVYDHRDELEPKRHKARMAVEHLTWENASEILDRTLLDIL